MPVIPDDAAMPAIIHFLDSFILIGILPMSYMAALFPVQVRHCGCSQAKIVIAKSGLSFLEKIQCVFVVLELDRVCDRQEFGTQSRWAPTCSLYA